MRPTPPRGARTSRSLLEESGADITYLFVAPTRFARGKLIEAFSLGRPVPGEPPTVARSAFCSENPSQIASAGRPPHQPAEARPDRRSGRHRSTSRARPTPTVDGRHAQRHGKASDMATRRQADHRNGRRQRQHAGPRVLPPVRRSGGDTGTGGVPAVGEPTVYYGAQPDPLGTNHDRRNLRERPQ